MDRVPSQFIPILNLCLLRAILMLSFLLYCSTFSRSSMWAFQDVFWSKLCICKGLFWRVLMTCYYNGTALSCFQPNWTKALKVWSTVSVHGYQKRRGAFKFLCLLMHCICSALLQWKLSEAREISFVYNIYSMLYSCLWNLYNWQKENMKFSITLVSVP